RYLAQLSTQPGAAAETDLFRLQKLLYLVQGWSLALRGRTAFNEPIEAWADGPVVPVVHEHFKHFGAEARRPDQTGRPEGITAGDAAFIECIWRQCTDVAQNEATQMAPWLASRTSLQTDPKSAPVITLDSLRQHFDKAAEQLQKPGQPDPREAWQAVEEFER